MHRQLFEYHPAIGYRFVPGIRARVRHEAGGYLVCANQSGFRCGHEFEKGRRAKGHRILLFGDSFTAGDGVSNPYRYGDQLEQLVDGLEVYNFGLPGTGPDQHYLAFREFAKDIPCDAIVIAVLVENIHRIVAKFRDFLSEKGERLRFAKPYFELSGQELTLKQVPPPVRPIRPDEKGVSKDEVAQDGRFPLLRKVVNRLGIRDTVQKVVRYQPVPEYDESRNSGWQLMRGILLQWIGECGKPVILTPLPLYQHVEETADAAAYLARFRELATEAGCTFHDPLPDLLAYPQAERKAFRFFRDIHPTPAGHLALAQSLAPVISGVLAKKGKA